MSHSAPAPLGRVLNEGDDMDLLPGMCFPDGEDQPNFRNLHAVVVEGALDEQRLRRAVDALQARHPRMRARAHLDPRTSQNLLLETSEKIPLYVREGSYDGINVDLERELRTSVDFANGPLCWVTYVQHPGGRGLLVFGNTHGVADGRGLEIAMSHLLRLYDGQDVGFYENVASVLQMRRMERERAVRWWSCEDPIVSQEKLKEWRSVQHRHWRFQRKGDLRSNVLNSTFVEPPHLGFKAAFDGVVIEIARLSKEQQEKLLRACRAAGTTVTGAVVAAYQYAATKQLAARDRGAETVTVGIDMNYRRYLGPRFQDEMGNFAFDVYTHIPVGSPFWETATGSMDFVKEVLDRNIGVEGMIVCQGGLSRDKVLLMRKMTPALLAGQFGGSEHGNISSLGLLNKFGQYRDFKVLENITAAHIMFMGVKVNVCTSGSSGVLTLSVMVTKNIVEEPRALAKAIAEDMRKLLSDPPPLPAADEGNSPGGEEPNYPASIMQPLLLKNRQRLSSTPRGGDGSVFLGNSSGAHNLKTHLKLALDTLLSILTAGPFMSIPFYFDALEASGAFDGVCEAGVRRCNRQTELLSLLVNVSGGLVLTLSIFAGFVYDVFGAQRAARIGGLVASVAMCFLSLALQLDGHSWPATQGVLLYTCFAVADLGGLLASLGVMGWLWHYPRHQGAIIGLSNLTYQASGPVLAWIFNQLTAQGISMAQCFLVAAALSALAAQGLYATLPSRAEYLEQAGRVLAVLPDMVDVSSMVSWRHFRYHVAKVWCTTRLYPVQNCLFFASILFGLLGVYYRLSNLSDEFDLFFGRTVADDLMTFSAVVQLLSCTVNVVAGVLIDRYGIARFYAWYSVLLIINAAFVSVQTVWAQKISLVAAMVWFGAFQTLLIKWPAHFAPSEVFGSFFGAFLSSCGTLVILFSPLIMAMQPRDRQHYAIPSLLFAVLAALSAVTCAVALRTKSYGMPATPPRSSFG